MAKETEYFGKRKRGTIRAECFSTYNVPYIAEYLRAYPRLLFQQDNAPGYLAKLTVQVMRDYGIQPICWPPNLPDLSPIESIRDEQKDWIQDLDPQLYKDYTRLQY